MFPGVTAGLRAALVATLGLRAGDALRSAGAVQIRLASGACGQPLAELPT
ncbi:MAG: hypothetical protein ACOH1Y_08925 [Propionicimonas sp.]